MMKRIRTLTKGTGLLFLLMLAAGHVAGGEPARKKTPPTPPVTPPEIQSEAPPIVEIDAVTSATTRYMPVQLNHQAHAELYDIQCRDCHAEKPHGDLNAYYHRLCLGCHRARQGEGAKGPPDCFVCHRERH